ncbi:MULTISPECIES: GlsB/YeaQ/YmgE family stress response membrane protein [unclassified Frankia]
MFQILWIVLAGLVIGLLARLIVRGRQNIPLWLTVGFGIIGALVGNVIASALGVRHTGGFDWIRHILQVGVAVALVAIVSPMWAARRGQSTGTRRTAGRP